MTEPLERDPSVDQLHELYPEPEFVEDMTGVLEPDASGELRQVVGENVTGDGVAHFLRISADGEHCGGCGKVWPCEHRVGVEVVEVRNADQPTEPTAI